ncbi:MAG TPA: hypothetical protein VM581_04020 [Magnetospirillaceae bacterium]|nr:hypothetical protein [Magnetospirillaceae bacterium]
MEPPKPQVTWVIGKGPKLATPAAITTPTTTQPAEITPTPDSHTETPTFSDPRDTPIEYLDLPESIYSRIKRQGLNSAGELSDHREKIQEIAAKRRTEIAARLEAIGLPCNLPA